MKLNNLEKKSLAFNKLMQVASGKESSFLMFYFLK